MQTLLKVFAVVALMVGFASTSQAQVVLSNTTLSGAITSESATSFVLASASASSQATVGAPAAGNCLYVEHEMMQITAISSTRVTVIRGTGGTAANKHPTSAVVFTGACSNFKASDPEKSAGLSALKACTTASMGVRPWINVITGDVWLCKSSVWTATNAKVITYNSVDPF